MRTLLVAGLLLALAPNAHALEIGTSYGVGVTSNFLGVPVYPSLDLRSDGFIVQTYPVELITFLAGDVFYLGADAYLTSSEQPGPGEWRRVLQPGGSIDASVGPDGVALMAAGRFGLEHPAGVGVYVIPALGVAYANSDADLASEGRIAFSVWFDGGAGGDGGASD